MRYMGCEMLYLGVLQPFLCFIDRLASHFWIVEI